MSAWHVHVHCNKARCQGTGDVFSDIATRHVKAKAACSWSVMSMKYVCPISVREGSRHVRDNIRNGTRTNMIPLPLVLMRISVSMSGCDVEQSTVEPLTGYTPRWIARAMGYERLWVLRGQFGCKFQIGRYPNLWGIGAYGLQEVWVMRVLTVVLKA